MSLISAISMVRSISSGVSSLSSPEEKGDLQGRSVSRWTWRDGVFLVATIAAVAGAILTALTQSYLLVGLFGIAVIGSFAGWYSWRQYREVGNFKTVTQDLAKERDKLREERNELHKNNEEYKKENERLQATISRLDEKIGVLKSTTTQLSGEIKGFQKQNKQLEGLIQGVEKNFEKHIGVCRKLIDDMGKSDTQIKTSLNQLLVFFEIESSRFRDELDLLRKCIGALSGERVNVDEIKNNFQLYAKNLTHLQDQLDRARSDLETATQELKTAQQGLSRERDAFVEMERQFAETARDQEKRLVDLLNRFEQAMKPPETSCC
ncbi:hypothetical protein JYU14_03880 [Simkania negevensis]|uniref:Chromosome partition protein Smc n=1 Tax=Simkania negevensis TaxID=83561 RepID=A0ABS3AS60_9BACT|nr:hypothetical protein [Simkania negevensis]